MKCICGYTTRNTVDYHRHYTSSIHKSYVTTLDYNKCNICYNINHNINFLTCKQCKNKTCVQCYKHIFISKRRIRCPYCRYEEF